MDLEKRGLYIVRGAMFGAVALVIPIVFHMFGGGMQFEPMIIVLFLAGFFVSVEVAAAISILIPTVSALVTHMPLIWPPLFAVVMLHALVVSVPASIMYRKFRWNPYVIVPLCILLGKIPAYGGTLLLVKGLGFTGIEIFGIGAVLIGIPGNIIELLVIPPTVMMLMQRRVTVS